MQKPENKRQRIKEAPRKDLLNGMEFSLMQDLCDCRKKKTEEENAEYLFSKTRRNGSL